MWLWSQHLTNYALRCAPGTVQDRWLVFRFSHAHRGKDKGALENNSYLLFFAPSNFSASTASTSKRPYIFTAARQPLPALVSLLPHHILLTVGDADLHTHSLSASPNSKYLLPNSAPIHPRPSRPRPTPIPSPLALVRPVTAHESRPSFRARLRSRRPPHPLVSQLATLDTDTIGTAWTERTVSSIHPSIQTTIGRLVERKNTANFRRLARSRTQCWPPSPSAASPPPLHPLPPLPTPLATPLGRWPTGAPRLLSCRPRCQ